MLKGKAYDCDRCKKEFTLEADETVFQFPDGGYQPDKDDKTNRVEDLCPACCEEFVDWLRAPKAAKSK